MSFRELVGTISILTLLGVFLAAMYRYGRIGLLEIFLLIAMGIVFVGGTIYVYGQMWSQDMRGGHDHAKRKL